jgi:hypothetical protein
MNPRLLLAGSVACLLSCTGCGSNDDGGDGTSTGGASGFGSTGAPGTNGSGGSGISTSSGGVSVIGAGGIVGAGGSATGAGGSLGATGGAPVGGGAAAGGVANLGGMSGTASGGAPVGGTGGASTAGAAGMGGAPGTAGAGGAGSTDDPCAGGMAGPASDKGSPTRASGYGTVEFTSSTKTQLESLETTLTVPAKPPPMGTLFLWPGLEPLQNSANYSPIGTGVLQPVLTWGGTCAPHAPNDYSSWWISAQYVNTLASAPGHTGCLGGDGMDVGVGDDLHISMSLSGTTWSQEVTDVVTGKKVTFDIDMEGQAQNWVIFSIEAPTGLQPASDVVFESTVITLAGADAAHCTPSTRGTNDFFTAPRSSADGRKCCVAKIILRGKGVPASGPNQ